MRKLILTFFLVSLTSSLVFAKGEKRGKSGGWRESYGGDATVSEFQNIAREIHAGLRLAPLTNDKTSHVDLDLFEDKIDETIISCGENLEIDGIKKDAINYPLRNPQQIIFDCNKWNGFTKSNKNRLVLHEFLHLMLIDDSNYEFSSALIRKYNQQQELDLENQERLFEAINECNINKARKILRKEINLYTKNEDNKYLSDVAIEVGCPRIISLLITEGAPFQLFTDLINENSSYIYLVRSIFKLTISSTVEYSLSLDFNQYFSQIIENNQQLKEKLESIKILTQFNPEYLKIEMNPCSGGFSSPYVQAFQPICTPKISQSCYKNSSPLHYLANGFRELENPLVNNSLMKSLIHDFIDAGYSLDQKNICGETPEDILNRNKIEK